MSDSGKKPTVVISPFGGKFYTYVDMLKDMYAFQGCRTVSLREAAKSMPPFRGVDEVVLNWFDEIGPCSPLKARLSIAFKSCLLSYWRARGVKVTVVIHNRIGHYATNEAANRELRRICCEKASRIVVLCRETEGVLRDVDSAAFDKTWKGKVQLIPHPSFSRIGDAELPYVPHEGEEFTFLFVGTVNRYKNIDLILDVAKRFLGEGKDARFHIAGTSKDVEYLSKVASRADELPNVTFENRGVPDEELPELIKASDILLLPYDRKSSLNSGTCVLAYTFGRNTICPTIGTTSEYPDELIYTYDYDSSDEQLEQLLMTVETSFDDWTHRKDLFISREKELQRLTNADCSQQKLSAAFSHFMPIFYESKN